MITNFYLLISGALHQAKRKIEWETKRIFFLTPQVMMNDLLKQVCRAKSIKCLVIDEAHKAMGNHAYCQVHPFEIDCPTESWYSSFRFRW